LKFHKVGIVAKPYLPARKVARAITTYLIKQGLSVYTDMLSKRNTPIHAEGVPSKIKDMKDIDFVISLGGDGTLLYISQNLQVDVPVFPVNMGSRGYLTEATPSEIKEGIRKILNGDYYIDERTKLKVLVNDERIYDALNELLLNSCPASRLLLTIKVDYDEINPGLIDSLIVSTTTGSTAHALSAGAPLIDPRLDVFVVVPVNPLSLSMRPIIVGATSKIEIQIQKGSRDVSCLVDGRLVKTVPPSTTIKVEKSERTFKIIRFKEIRFLSRAKEKLMK